MNPSLSRPWPVASPRLASASYVSVSLSDHRVQAQPSDCAIRIELDGETIAESSRAVRLEETGHRTRWYLPREDIRAELRSSEKHTRCPFKGEASYHHVGTASGEHPDLVWFYPDPLPAVEAIRDRLAFYDERVALFVDGERAE